MGDEQALKEHVKKIGTKWNAGRCLFLPNCNLPSSISYLLGRLFFLGAVLAFGVSRAGAAAEPIHMGEFSSLSGREAGLGQYTHMGVQMAVEEINAAGGIDGRPLLVIVEDTQSKAGESATVVRKLITRDHVVAIIGEGASGRCLEGAPIAQRAGIPVVSPAATNPKVTEIGDCIFRVCFTDPFQGTVMAKFAHETLNVRRVGLLSDVASSYSVGLAGYFRRRCAIDGMEIVGEQKFSGGDKDYRAQLTAIKAARPDALFVPAYYGDAGLILLQARQLGLTIPVLGGDGFEAPELVQIAGAAADGAFFPVHFSTSDTSPRSRGFIERYTQRWQKAPTGVSALGYDALNLIADAIRRGKSAEPKAIRAALAATTAFEGITGRIDMDPERNARKPASIVRVEGGQFRFLQTVAP